MAKSVRTSPTSGRMSSIVSGDRSRVTRTPSTVYAQSPLYNPELGMPSTRTTFGTAPGKTNRQKAMPAPTGVAQVTPPKNIPRSYVPSRIKQIFDPTPFATPVVKKPPVKKPPVISNVVREKTTPVKAAPPARAKPPATRFGVVTGTTTGTKTSGGGGYGGGGTRGGGSLSGGGSGSRSAGTSRTGGTRGNDPVRG